MRKTFGLLAALLASGTIAATAAAAPPFAPPIFHGGPPIVLSGTLGSADGSTLGILFWVPTGVYGAALKGTQFTIEVTLVCASGTHTVTQPLANATQNFVLGAATRVLSTFSFSPPLVGPCSSITYRLFVG
jgi:hypothetical protein